MTPAGQDGGRAGSAFDGLAPDYDATFSDLDLGRLLRRSAWTWLDRAFGPGDRVLELGCGTGLDAVHLASRGVAVVATDASMAMLEVTRGRVASANAGDLVRVARLDLGEVGAPGWIREPEGAAADGEAAPNVADVAGSVLVDGAYADFGVLNCLADRRALFRGLADVVRPGGRLVLVSMPPFCPWEVAWHALHGQPSTALRRWRRGGVARLGAGGRVRVWYTTPRTLRREASPWFRVMRTGGIGVALPPSELAQVMQRHRRALRALAALERRVAHHPAAAWAADHAVLELVRA